MPQRCAWAWDADRFRDDIEAFMDRQGLTANGLATRAGIGGYSLRRYLDRQSGASVTVETAAALASACDLNLGNYATT